MKRLAKLSQRYLRNPALAHELISQTTINKNDLVLDIGAGSGVISYALSQRSKKVIAVELDRRIIVTLRKNTQSLKNVHVLHTDFLKMSLPKTGYKVFSNIPFSLSSAIVRKLTQSEYPPTHSYLVVQREFAQKLITNSNAHNSLLGILLGIDYKVDIMRSLAPRNFVPSPRVRTVLLCIIKRKKPLMALDERTLFKSFVTNSYGHTRTLRKAIKRNIPYAVFKRFLRSECLAHNIRPSQLNLEQWIKLYKLTRV